MTNLKKAIVNTLVATTMLTSVAAQAVTWNSDYGVITGLTDSHISWLDTHRVDSNAGILGGFAWARLSDGSYTSMKVSEIRDAGSVEKAKEIFVQQIIEVESGIVIDGLRAEIQEKVNEINALQDQVDTLTPLAEANPGLITEIARLEAVIQSKVDFVAPAVVALQVMEARTAGFNAGQQDIIDNDSLYNNEDGHHSTLTSRMGGANESWSVTGVNSGIYWENSVVNTRIQQSLASQMIDLAEDFRNGAPISYMVSQFGQPASDALRTLYTAAARIDAISPADTNADGVISDAEIAAYTDGGNFEASLDVNYGTDVSMANLARNAGYNQWDPTFLSLANFLNGNSAVDTLIRDLFDEVFEDGYEAGYKDGYKDGFADGVDSVR